MYQKRRIKKMLEKVNKEFIKSILRVRNNSNQVTGTKITSQRENSIWRNLQPISKNQSLYSQGRTEFYAS